METNAWEAVARLTDSEAFTRRVLSLLEAEHRALALRLLAAWERTGLVATELFQPVSCLQRPSWGSWNGVLLALRSARRRVLRSGSVSERQKLDGEVLLRRTLVHLDENVTPEVSASLAILRNLVGAKESRTFTHENLLSLPISLRNRIAHDSPGDPAWWKKADEALRPLLAFRQAESQVPESDYPDPWYRLDEGRLLTFNGLTSDLQVIYASAGGESKLLPEPAGRVLLAFQRLLGKADIQAQDFRKLLGKLAPEEVKGVLMGDYLVGPPVGSGGFATVHAGRQLSTGRKVAIKILHDGMAEDGRRRFHLEAEYLSRFDHPNIVGVIGFGEEAWSAPRAFSLSEEPWFREFSKGAAVKTYLALDWIEGRTLESVFKEGEIRDPVRLAEAFAQAAAGLTAVHAAGLIHRDVKPSNLMLRDDGRIVLMDFGIARSQSEERTLLTTAGTALGTPAYMSPEQIRAGDVEAEVGPGTDVYSLCATFYELFTGARLFDHDRESPETIRTRKLSGARPDRPSLRRTGLPWEVETLLLGGLEPEIADRVQGMACLEQDLRRFLNDEPILYRRPGLARRIRLGYRRNRTVSNLVAAFCALAIAGVATYIQSIRAEQERTLAAKGRAEAGEGKARENLSRFLEEQGLQELARDNPGPASVFLSAAYSEGGLRPGLATLLDHALRPYRARRHVLTPHETKAEVLSFTPADGGYLLTAGEDKTLIVSSLREGHCSAPLRGHTDAIVAGWVAPGGERSVTIAEDGVGIVWDVKAARIASRVDLQVAGPLEVTFSEDGTVAYVLWHKPEAQGRSTSCLTAWPTADPAPKQALPVPGASVGLLRVSRSGDSLLTLEKGNSVAVRDLRTGKPMVTFGGGESSIDDAVFSPDGRLVATAAENGTLVLWDARTGRQKHSLGHPAGVSGLAFSPDGTRLLSRCEDRIVRIWRVTEGSLVGSLEGHRQGITSASFSPSGDLVITASDDRSVKVWDVETRARLAVFDGHETGLSGAVTDGTTHLASVAGKTIVVWDLAAGTQGYRPPAVAAAGNTFDLTPDGRFLAAADAGGGSRIVPLFSRSAPVRLERHPSAVTALSCDPAGGRVITACGDPYLRVWDTGSGRLLQQIEAHSGGTHGARFSPDGQLAVSFGADPSLILWRTAGWTREAVLLKESLSANVECEQLSEAVFAPGARAVLLRGKAFLHSFEALWQPSDGSLKVVPGTRGTITHGFHAGLLNGDGSKTATAVTLGRPVLKLWETGSAEAREVLSAHENTIAWIGWAPGGDEVLTTGNDGLVKLWGFGSATPRLVLRGNEGPVTAAAFSRDGGIAATGGAGGSICLWEISSGRELGRLPGGDKGITHLRLIPSGDGFLTRTAEGLFLSWRLGRETASAQAVKDLVSERVPWTLENGRLTARTIPPAERMKASAKAPPVELPKTVAAAPLRSDPAPGIRDALRASGGTALWVGGSSLWRPMDSLSCEVRMLSADRARKCVAALFDHGPVAVFDGETGKFVRSIPIPYAGPYTAMALSADGKVLVIGEQNRVTVWSTEGTLIREIRAAGRSSVVTLLDEAGAAAAVGTDSGILRIWNLKTGAALHEWKEQKSRLTALELSPDGRYLASADAKGVIVVRDLKAETFSTLSHPQEGALSLAFSPDSRSLVTGGGDLRLWPLSGTSPLWTIKPYQSDWVSAVAFGADGRHVVTVPSGEGKLRLWSASSGEGSGEEARPLRGASALMVLGQARYLIGTRERGLVQAGAMEPAEPQPEGHGGDVLAISASSDGSVVLSGARDGSLLARDGTDGKVLWSKLDLGGPITTVWISDDGTVALSLVESFDELKLSPPVLWDVRKGTVLHELVGHAKIVVAGALSSDGTIAVSADEAGQLRTWDVKSGKLRRTVKMPAVKKPKDALEADPRHVMALAVDPVGSRVVVAYEDGAIRTFDLESGAVKSTTRIPRTDMDGLSAIALSRNGATAAVIPSASSAEVLIWATGEGGKGKTIRLTESSAHGVALSSTGKELMVSTNQGALLLWDLGTDTKTAEWSFTPVPDMPSSFANVQGGDLMFVATVRSLVIGMRSKAP